MRTQFHVLVLSVISSACMTGAFAAKPVDLQNQPLNTLKSFVSQSVKAAPQPSLKQISKNIDFKRTAHIRIQQMMGDYPVYGGDAILHVEHGQGATLENVLSSNSGNVTMNGVMYQNLSDDLAGAPAFIFSPEQADKAAKQAIQTYQNKSGHKHNVSDVKKSLMVFVDDKNKAHWSYFIYFMVTPDRGMPAKPTYIMDAVTFNVYQQWDNLQTLDEAQGGGFGGNEKMGKLIYDGLQGNLSTLSIQRDAEQNLCYLQNAEVIVKDARNKDAIVNFPCEKSDADHNNTFFDADFDAVNGGYSPANDALFIGKVVKDMYQNWYGLPVLVEAGKPMLLSMRVHIVNYDNAFWDGKQMSFGDGATMFYPLVSFGVGAHEISHGFTQQHSNLQYRGQSGGLNESFSDMAAQAAEFYGYGHNTWQIGPEIFKQKDRALRYMDQPSKDCEGRNPGTYCSIDNVKQYTDWLDVHYSSGIFNRVFYMMGTAEGWDTKKAFDVMVKANTDYWTSTTTFAAAACGVVKATKDYGYDMDAVKMAMKAVGIEIKKC